MSLLALLVTRSPAPTPALPLDTVRAVASTPIWSRGIATARGGMTWQAPLTLNAPTDRLQVTYQYTGTIAAAVEIDGTVYPFTFNGQARTPTATASTLARSDMLTIPRQDKGTNVRFRVFGADGSTVQAGMPGWQQGITQSTTGDLTVAGSGAIPTNGGIMEGRVGPVSVSGYTSAATVAVAGIGDSIVEGGNDAPYEATNPGGGFFIRGMRAAQIPGSSYGVWATNTPTKPDTDPRFAHGLDNHTHALVEYGTNALTGAKTWQDVAIPLVSFWTWLAAKGLKVAQTTLIPKTWGDPSTVEGQTVAGADSEARRLAFNAWLRDGAPLDAAGAPATVGASGAKRMGDTGHPLGWVVDTDATVSAVKADGSVVFAVDPVAGALVSDGTHPSAAGHARMASAVAAWAGSLTA